jgi:hypothetical protein
MRRAGYVYGGHIDSIEEEEQPPLSFRNKKWSGIWNYFFLKNSIFSLNKTFLGLDFPDLDTTVAHDGKIMVCPELGPFLIRADSFLLFSTPSVNIIKSNKRNNTVWNLKLLKNLTFHNNQSRSLLRRKRHREKELGKQIEIGDR